ncbi:MAG: hypothetical protein ABSF91_10155 [Bacteroidota bacterium]|jgi:hypothetical protein
MNKEELKKVTYLQVDHLQGRSVPLFACYHDDGTWELWLPNNGGLQRMMSTGMVEGMYFGKSPAHKGDVYLEFFDFMCKRAYWKQVVPFIQGISDDLQNLSACLAKLDLFYKESKQAHFESRRFVITELEYLFSVCRSLYDLLQECNSKMWSTFTFNDPSIGKKPLPASFREMILENNQPRTKEQIVSRYAVPDMLAQYYTRQADFFTWLREYRDYISHSGKSLNQVFVTKRGFALSIDTKPFSSMSIWSDKNTEPHKLGSVRSFTAHLIISTFKAVEEFAFVMSRIIVFPPDIAPDYHVFICGPHIRNLQDLETQIQDKPWYE